MSNKYTDRIDVNTQISLYEYGIIRNPVNGKTIICKNYFMEHTKEHKPEIYSIFITFEEVKEVLEFEMKEGFFDYIGENKETVLKNLDNNYLTIYLFSIWQWNDYMNLNGY